jgi:hypothetical protein
LLVEHGETEICKTYTGLDEDLYVTAEAEAFVKWHAGQLSWAEALRDSRIQLHGPSWLMRAFPTWNARSMFAHIKPASGSGMAAVPQWSADRCAGLRSNPPHGPGGRLCAVLARIPRQRHPGLRRRAFLVRVRMATGTAGVLGAVDAPPKLGWQIDHLRKHSALLAQMAGVSSIPRQP